MTRGFPRIIGEKGCFLVGSERMGKLILTGIELYTPWEVIRPATLEVVGGRVRRITEGKDHRGENLDGAIVAPGFIDLHIHGYGGLDINSGDPGEILSLAELLPRYGVTAFLPTAVTAPHEKLLEISRAVAEAMVAQGDRPHGARILGLHLEGPYINPNRAGAQNPELIRPPDWDEFRGYWSASRGKIRAITLAPELPGALEFIARATALGITVSIGHTDATYAEAQEAIAAGARRATHLFNAMPPVHHRAPGAAIACLLAPEVTVELIPDRVHIADPMLRLAWQLAGTERTVLVSDAIAAGGLADGRYRFGGQGVEVRGGVARLEDGTLAGGTLLLDEGVRNALAIGIPLREAVAAATAVPARACGLGELGTLAPGSLADFLVLDRKLNILRVYIAGTRLV